MKKIILVLVLLIFLIGCGKEPVEIYKGVYMPTLSIALLNDTYKPALFDLDKAIENGVDTLAVGPVYLSNEEGKVSLVPGTKDFLISYIENAQARGFKIWLIPEILTSEEIKPPTRISDEILENTDLMQDFDLAIIEWAKIAQEYNIEIFSPVNEPHAKFGMEKMKKWLPEIKLKIEAVYSGKICTRGEWFSPELSSYSCFSPTIEIPKNKEEENEFVSRITRLSEEAKQLNIELILGEIYWLGTEDEKRSITIALEAVKDKVNGFLILDLPHLTSVSHPTLFENFESEVKEFYTQEE